jgi:hypothetical protein
MLCFQQVTSVSNRLGVPIRVAVIGDWRLVTGERQNRAQRARRIAAAAQLECARELRCVVFLNCVISGTFVACQPQEASFATIT